MTTMIHAKNRGDKFLSLFVRFLLSMIISFYGYSIMYYTIYGIYKGYNEYYCLQKHPSFINRKEYFKPITSLQFWPYVGNSDLGYLDLVNKNGKLVYRNFYNGTNESFSELGDTINGMDTHIKLSKPDTSGSLNNDITLFKYQVEDNYFTIMCEPSKEISNSSGFLDNDGWLIYLAGDTKLNESRLGVSCMQLSKFSTCELQKSTKDYVFRLYLYLMIPIFCLFILMKVRVLGCYNLRLKNDILEFVSNCCNFKTTFCNPMTGNYTNLEIGDAVNVFCSGCFNLNSLLESPKSSNLKDKTHAYWIKNRRLYKTNLGNLITEEFDLAPLNCLAIKAYFFECNVNPKNCVVNNDFTHYLNTEYVITKLIEGSHMYKSISDKAGFIQDVELAEVEVLSKMFSYSKKVLIKLIEHNKLFFGELNILALTLLLRNKGSHVFRPSKINNSTWKWYGSDVANIMKTESNVRIFSQVKWRESKALLRIIENDEIVISGKSIETNIELPKKMLDVTEVSKKIVSDICKGDVYMKNKIEDPIRKPYIKQKVDEISNYNPNNDKLQNLIKTFSDFVKDDECIKDEFKINIMNCRSTTLAPENIKRIRDSLCDHIKEKLFKLKEREDDIKGCFNIIYKKANVKKGSNSEPKLKIDGNATDKSLIIRESYNEQIKLIMNLHNQYEKLDNYYSVLASLDDSSSEKNEEDKEEESEESKHFNVLITSDDIIKNFKRKYDYGKLNKRERKKQNKFYDGQKVRCPLPNNKGIILRGKIAKFNVIKLLKMIPGYYRMLSNIGCKNDLTKQLTKIYNEGHNHENDQDNKQLIWALETLKPLIQSKVNSKVENYQKLKKEYQIRLLQKSNENKEVYGIFQEYKNLWESIIEVQD